MIYLDSSVALALLLSEPRQPDAAFWQQQLTSSRLLEYEVWNQLHANRLGRQRIDVAHALLRAISFIELTPAVLARAIDPFPRPVRTLDGLHLASLHYSMSLGQEPTLACYDSRLNDAAEAIGIPLYKF